MGKISGWSRSAQRNSKAQSPCISRIKKSLKKHQKISKGLKCSTILRLTDCFPRFIGCFAEKTVQTLKLMVKPVFFMVHIGTQNGHWIAIGVFNDKIEIFDPLGFDIFNWSRVPCDLLDFLHRLSVTRHVQTAPRVQSDSSYLCGFYAIFYVIARKFLSFENLFKCFCTNFLSRNDKTLYEFFKNA